MLVLEKTHSPSWRIFGERVLTWRLSFHRWGTKSNLYIAGVHRTKGRSYEMKVEMYLGSKLCPYRED